LTLENEALRVTVLPDKGADIVELVHLATGADPLFKAPWGLQPPGSEPRDGWGGFDFLANYEGGWQELFPSVNEPATSGGETIPFHGEVATLPWEAHADREGTLRLSVRCLRTPFRLQRRMRLEGASLVLDEAVTNEGRERAYLVWGHHCVVGPPFLEAGCRLHVPARTVETVPEMWEKTARLEPGQRSAWPLARLRGGGTVDLSVVPGPDARSHDDVYVTDLEAGWAVVENPRFGLSFRLDWDASLFRWLISWQPYGGAEAMPLRGSYALGVEPWTSRLNLEQAVAAGEGIALDPGASLATIVRATIEEDGSWQR
jgi:hypothetical protein